MNSNYPSQPPRVPPPPPPTDTGGGRRHGLFYGGCAVAALLALMGILVLGALIFLVALGSSGGGGRPSGSDRPPERTTPGQKHTEIQYLNDVIVNQVGPYTLDAWEWNTADATAAGALDGVALRYQHYDGTELSVIYWEWSTSSASSSFLNSLVSDAQSNGYQIADEFTVEVEGEQVGQGVLLHRNEELEWVVWTNGELIASAQAPTVDYLQEYYDSRPY